MRITVLAVGKMRGPLVDLCDDYVRRLPWPVRVDELAESRPLKPQERISREAGLLRKALPKGSTVIALDERGATTSSAEFAKRLGAWQDRGIEDVAFLIGGAEGLDPTLRDNADFVLAFGRMTWPHLLTRLLLFEQLYRASTILSGHPYHRA
jgi:23S rRNA (pseudouridine1915-N3)-methyltransferase